jgi:L-rhamnose mutarotase
MTRSGRSCPRLLRDSGIYDYSIFLDEATLDLFAVMKLRRGTISDAAAASGDARWWDTWRT